MATTTCPIFYPNEEEFLHFSDYIKKIDQERGNHNILIDDIYINFII